MWNTQKWCLSHSKCHVNISYYYRYFGKHLEGLAHKSQRCLQFTACSQSVFQNPLKLQLTNGGLEPHLVIKILSVKACAITLPNPTLCRLPFMSLWDTIVASVRADYVMSTRQYNSRYNWLWHVRKWQISSRNLKRWFSKVREGAEPGCEMGTAYKLEAGKIPDLALSQLGSPHNLYLAPSFCSLNAPDDWIGYYATLVCSIFPRRDLFSRMFSLNSLLFCSEPKILPLHYLTWNIQGWSDLRAILASGV